MQLTTTKNHLLFEQVDEELLELLRIIVLLLYVESARILNVEAAAAG